MRRLYRRVAGGEDGAAYAAVEMILVLGLILLPLLAGIAQIPRWVDAKSTADLAAQEAARRVALADSWDEGVAAGLATVATVVSNRGIDVGSIEDVRFTGELVRGGTVSVSVTLVVSPVVLPGFGPIGGNISLSRSATERVDDYRQIDG